MIRINITAAVLLLGALTADAATWYVATNGNDGAAGTNWATAKQTIQAAIDASAAGDDVWVSNGVYSSGGRVNPGGTLTNRVVVDKPVAVRSVNGPAVTAIAGAADPLYSNGWGPAAVRCVYLTSNASLSGFTVTNGYARNEWSLDGSPAGVLCAAQNSVISNCNIQGNRANGWGGGAVYRGTVHNSVIANNYGYYGAGLQSATAYNTVIRDNMAYMLVGGAMQSTLHNCTVVQNQFLGQYNGTAYNSIIDYNGDTNNFYASTIVNCCTRPLASGSGNIPGPPGIVSPSNPLLLPGSPCIDAGSNGLARGATDLDGEARTNGVRVDIGADEYVASGLTGSLAVTVSAVPVVAVVSSPVVVRVDVAGRLQGYVVDFGDGTAATNLFLLPHSYASTGVFTVTLTASNLDGAVTATTTVTVVSSEYFVAPGGGHIAPFDTWAKAATNIQAAIDAAPAGATVWVSNGVYSSGGRVLPGGTLTNRVVVDKPVTVRSVNGPASTTIAGSGPLGAAAARCVYVGSNATLAGFTLTNGATLNTGPFADLQKSGGGAQCAPSATISNCIITGNQADYSGGGSYNGTLIGCQIVANTAGTQGGGSDQGLRYNCSFLGNSSYYAGAVANGSLFNCTLVGNTAAASGGGAHYCTVNNSIVYYNTAPASPNSSNATLNASCTWPMPSGGSGNFTNAPVLSGINNPHLLPGSPCIDAGSNSLSRGAADIDGETRTNGVSVDVGADEFYDSALTGALVAAIGVAPDRVLPNSPTVVTVHIGGRPLGHVLDYGDGATTTNSILTTHSYATTGVFTVTLTASNLDGAVVATTTVTVVSSDYFVAPGGGHIAPFDTWTKAATNIQAAIDVALPGATVWVSNGLYNSGGRALPGNALTNRIVITNAISVRSVNGPSVTTIMGAGQAYDAVVVRCAYVGTNATLAGFTLTNGATLVTYDQAAGYGGGALGAGTISNCVVTGCSAYFGGGVAGATVRNSLILGNTAINSGGGLANCIAHQSRLMANATRVAIYGGGGGAYQCTLSTCLISGNSAVYHGGGSSYGTLDNCTLAGNSTQYGGGSYYDTLNNCIVYFNAATYGSNFYSSTMSHCCTEPSPGGTGNFTNTPVLAGINNAHLLPGSPCIDAGSGSLARSATDIDGEVRTNGVSVDVGADEFDASALAGVLIAAIGAIPATTVQNSPAVFTADIEGRPQGYRIDFGDGGASTNVFQTTHSYASTGVFTVTLTASNLDGTVTATTTVTVVSSDYFVAPGGGHIAPFDTWAKAATNIQAAIDAAPPGATIWVSNGVYNTGGRLLPGGALTNRVVVDKKVTVRSVNGPEVTTIMGAADPAGFNGWGPAAVRCIYLTNDASLIGFTVTNGHDLYTYSFDGSLAGAGIRCESISAAISNCVITGNSGYYASGGGVYGGTLFNCTISGNRNAFGGGVAFATLNHCALIDNAADMRGGGADNATLNNCIILGNSSVEGGGASYTMANNCTIIANQASSVGGGSAYGTINNGIVYFNAAPSSPNWAGGTFQASCTWPLPAGGGNGSFTNQPMLAGGIDNAHLLAGSPCIDAGSNTFVFGATDLDGEARTNGVRVDVGADEYHAAGLTGALSAAISAAPSSTATNSPVVFTAALEGRPQGYVLDFGDGAAATNAFLATHSYASTGVFTVTLTASNLDGMVTATTTVVVASSEFFVAPGGGHIAPFDTWTKAATNIQAAIDAAPPGATVWVSNGVYDTGGRVAVGTVTNRVVIDKALLVQSVNGPIDTSIAGYPFPFENPVRCAYLANGAVLRGFTLRDGSAQYASGVDGRGGGALLGGASNRIENCLVLGSRAYQGGGVYGGTLRNCILRGNEAADTGGGAQESLLENCTVVGNAAPYGGGVYAFGFGGGGLRNTIVFHNTADMGSSNYFTAFGFSVAERICTLPAVGTNPVTNDPQLVYAEFPRLLSGSPCIDAGANQPWMTGETDVEGDGRIDGAAVDVGADEWYPAGLTGPVAIAISGPPDVLSTGEVACFSVTFQGKLDQFVWSVGGADYSNQSEICTAFPTDGVYIVSVTATNLSGTFSDALSVTVRTVFVQYVATSGSDAADGLTWLTPKQTIQAAVDNLSVGGTIWVSNGVYATGGAVSPGGLITNRVYASRRLNLRSVNGADHTVIRGAPDPLLTNGPAAVRAVWLAGGGTLEGFTVDTGHTADTNVWNEVDGGGIVAAYLSTTVRWCRVEGNVAAGSGGGVLFASLENCRVISNRAARGGGLADGTAANCLLAHNTATEYGGGASDYAYLLHCTVADNSAPEGGGLAYCDASGSIVYGNAGGNHVGAWFEHSCTSPDPGGLGNTAGDPLFADAAAGDYRPLFGSPCLDAGAPWYDGSGATDLAALPRVVNGVADMGAYEFAYDGDYVLATPAWLVVPEGGAATVDVRLVRAPLYETTVTVARISGDTDLALGATTALVFTTVSWSNAQPVTLQAAEDADYLSGTAVFAFTSPGWTGALVTAVEADNEEPPLGEAVDAPALVWTTGGDAPWSGQYAATLAHDGVDVARSGVIGDGETTWLETTVAGPGTLQFWWRVSSEEGWDFLGFDVDGTNIAAISGLGSWQQINQALPAGTHTLRWTYSKDADCCVDGVDAAWVDQVTWTPAVADSDGDGIPDDWETQHGLNPAVSNSALANADADWMTDFEEYLADTDPTNGASYFRGATNHTAGGVFELRVFPTSTNRLYDVDWSTNLPAGSWTPYGYNRTGTLSDLIFVLTNDVPARNYRPTVRLP